MNKKGQKRYIFTYLPRRSVDRYVPNWA